MISRSRQPTAAAKELTLTSVLTLKGHDDTVSCISYFPDGKRMISVSSDQTTRRWDLEAGKEIEEARGVCELEVHAVGVSRDGRWVVTGGKDYFASHGGELKVCEVETGIVRRFGGHTRRIDCIDISADSTLLAGAERFTMRIWSLETGKLMAGPFESAYNVNAVRFSHDSKKLAVKSWGSLQVWDIQSQKLDVHISHGYGITSTPVLWTTKDKTIITAFSLTSHSPDVAVVNSVLTPYYPMDYYRPTQSELETILIHEFAASTLETVGAPFKGHTNAIISLALSLDSALLASASRDHTIKLWAFESRQLLASFKVKSVHRLILSPDSRQLVYTTRRNNNIHLCNTPPEILANIQPVPLFPSSSYTHTVFSARNVEPHDLPPEATLQDLSNYITKDGDYPVARGGFGEIWKCTFHINRRSVKVAVKALQVYAADQLGAAKSKKIKRILRELRICAGLKHPNILPVYGYTYGFGPFIAIVSSWAENGNLSDYLELKGAALTLVRRFRILRDIIAGLQYLHANSIIHGDFTGPNVLIHVNGTACVADFGLSLMYSEVISPSQASWTSTLKGNMRWMAPELLVEREDGSQVRPSEQSDMYSFGGIMLQVLTNKAPYYHLSNDAAIILCIAKSQTPSRSRYAELPERYWQLIEQCWSTDPWDRPSAGGADTAIRNEFYSLSRSGWF